MVLAQKNEVTPSHVHDIDHIHGDVNMRNIVNIRNGNSALGKALTEKLEELLRGVD